MAPSSDRNKVSEPTVSPDLILFERRACLTENELTNSMDVYYFNIAYTVHRVEINIKRSLHAL